MCRPSECGRAIFATLEYWCTRHTTSFDDMNASDVLFSSNMTLLLRQRQYEHGVRQNLHSHASPTLSSGDAYDSRPAPFRQKHTPARNIADVMERMCCLLWHAKWHPALDVKHRIDALFHGRQGLCKNLVHRTHTPQIARLALKRSSNSCTCRALSTHPQHPSAMQWLTFFQSQVQQDLQGPASSVRVGPSVRTSIKANEWELAPLMSQISNVHPATLS